jgi:hypothetical protein
MPDLSPAAASIVQAFDDRYEVLGPFDDNWQELCLAAALRAAADQVVPEVNAPPQAWGESYGCWSAKDDVRDKLLFIAHELEAS